MTESEDCRQKAKQMSDCDAVNPLDRDFIQSWERMEEFFGWMLARVLGKIGSFSLWPNFVKLDTIESSGLDKRSTSSSCRARASRTAS